MINYEEAYEDLLTQVRQLSDDADRILLRGDARDLPAEVRALLERLASLHT